jgi:16S rRNA (adenine1518-N6/adenine1519-N6)-dimethyltransferase
MSVKAKKYLGQHFLTDEHIAQKIADTLSLKGYDSILEIGPGMGMLTKYLLEKDVTTYVIEIDPESVEYLSKSLSLLLEIFLIIFQLKSSLKL